MLESDRQFIKENISKIALSERDQKLLDYRFGLTDNTLHTLEETGKMFGLTRERVRQIEEKMKEEITKRSKEDKQTNFYGRSNN